MSRSESGDRRRPHGLYVYWCSDLQSGPAEPVAEGYYPGVQCGMDYTHFLAGWANPDIVTLHHPYGVVADGNSVYVTGWSGEVQRLNIGEDKAP